MNSKQLHYFLITAQRKSIAAAAKTLDIAAPAISHQIANLEHELKTALFERNFRGVTLTAAGIAFQQHAKQLLSAMDDAKKAIDPDAEQAANTFTIGMNQAIGNVIAIPLIDAIVTHIPNTTPDVRSGTSGRLNKWLQKEKIDIAITYEEDIETQDISSTGLLEESMYLIVGKNSNNPVHQALLSKDEVKFFELNNIDLVTPNSRDGLTRLLQDYEAKSGIKLKYTLPYSGQLSTNLRYVYMGKALMIVPSSAMYHLEDLGMIHALRIIEPNISRKVVAARLMSHSQPQEHAKVLALIKQVVIEANKSDQWRGTLITND